ncbi:MAG: hypothetical protein KY460_11335 [Actinobacteria bacterium]|nr:hypothetical protein [Actinomycetota bacterium]
MSGDEVGDARLPQRLDRHDRKAPQQLGSDEQPQRARGRQGLAQSIAYDPGCVRDGASGRVPSAGAPWFGEQPGHGDRVRELYGDGGHDRDLQRAQAGGHWQFSGEPSSAPPK